MRVLLTGATGFLGRRLARRLREDGFEVRCLVRNVRGAQARKLERAGCELIRGDLRSVAGLAETLAGCAAAYYLVHMIGEGADYGAQEEAAASRFARAAREAGVGRVIYLGGLGADDASEHLASRHATAEALRADGPPLTYFRAAMVIGPGSESYELLRGIVQRLPFLPAPSWLETKTQPIGVDDAVAYLRAALDVPASVGREVEIGGPEVLSHQRVVDEMARALGLRPPRRFRVSSEIARPGTIAAGAAAVTSGSPHVAAAISLGLTTPTIVTDPGAAELFPRIRPKPLDYVLGKAVDEAAREAA